MPDLDAIRDRIESADTSVPTWVMSGVALTLVSDIERLRRERDALRAGVHRLRVLERAVEAAHDHDRECEEEGEGDCCYRAWRLVTILVGRQQVLTPEDAEMLDAALRDQEWVA